MIVDIYIVTYHSDFVWLEYCIKSVRKYASGFRDVVVVTDNDNHKIPQHILDIMPLKVIYENVPRSFPKNYIERRQIIFQKV